jgi:hypothetical protein
MVTDAVGAAGGAGTGLTGIAAETAVQPDVVFLTVTVKDVFGARLLNVVDV